MRKNLLIALLGLICSTAMAQQTVTPPDDATFYDYILYGVNHSPYDENDYEDLQDPIIVATKGNDVYVNGLCGFLPDAWVKGTLSGTTVTFLKDQYFGYDSSYGLHLYFMGFGTGNQVCDVTFEFDAASGTYTIGNMWILCCGEPSVAEPYYYLSDVRLAPGKVISDEPVEVPANLSASDYEFTGIYMGYDDDGNFVSHDVSRYCKVGFVGNSEVYVRGLCSQLPFSWVKGSVSGDAATFAKGQFYGVFTDYAGSYPLYFGGNYFSDDFCDMEWDYDTKSREFTRVTSYMVLNSEKESLAPYEKYANAKLAPMANTAKTPLDPSIVEFQEFVDYMNAGYVCFDIPIQDADGKALNLSRLGYTVYSDINGTISEVTFTPAEYEGLSAATTVLPYETYNGQSLFVGGSFVMLYDWMKDFNRIGVQSIYTGGNTENRSNIVWHDIKNASTDGIEAHEDALPVATTWHDLQGRTVSPHAKGIVIKTITRADGSRHSVKVAR